MTDIAVISVQDDGLVLHETAPGWSVADVQAETDAKLIIASDVKNIAL